MSDLVLRNICYRYPKTRQMVLHEINAMFREGTVTSIRGQSGAGKSTFINYSNIEYPLSDNSHLIFLYMFLKNRALLIQKGIIFPKKNFLFHQAVMNF